jgi:hypothetical protein
MLQIKPGFDPFILLHLFFKSDTELEILSVVYLAGISPSFGAEPRLSEERLYVTEKHFVRYCRNKTPEVSTGDIISRHVTESTRN